MDREDPAIALDHVAIVVRDIDSMIVFYRDIIGLDLLRTGTVPPEAIEQLAGAVGVTAKYAFLGNDRSAKIELGEFVPSGETRNPSAAFNTLGIRHVAFTVARISDVAERMAGSAYPTDLRIEEFVVASTGAIAKRGLTCDPEGNAIEFIERTPAVQ